MDSPRAVQFRKWANGIIEEFTIKRFTMDDERLKNFGTVLTKDYFLPRFKTNYIGQFILSAMARIVNAYLDLAELRAEEQVPMTMEDWAEQFEGLLRLSRKEILTHAGTISAQMAEQYALAEFEKYRIKPDQLYQSDFDRILIGDGESEIVVVDTEQN